VVKNRANLKCHPTPGTLSLGPQRFSRAEARRAAAGQRAGSRNTRQHVHGARPFRLRNRQVERGAKGAFSVRARMSRTTPTMVRAAAACTKPIRRPILAPSSTRSRAKLPSTTATRDAPPPVVLVDRPSPDNGRPHRLEEAVADLDDVRHDVG
jgi:hypothetical protein